MFVLESCYMNKVFIIVMTGCFLCAWPYKHSCVCEYWIPLTGGFYETSKRASAHRSVGYQPRSKHRVRGGQCHQYFSSCVSQWGWSSVNLESSLTIRPSVMSIRRIHWGLKLLCELMEIPWTARCGRVSSGSRHGLACNICSAKLHDHTTRAGYFTQRNFDRKRKFLNYVIQC